MEFKTSEKERERCKEYRQTHREQKRAYNKKYFQDNKELLVANNRKWALKYPERVRANRRKSYKKNPWGELAQCKIYHRDHPDEGRAKWRKRRARKNNAPGSHTVAEIKFLRSISGGFCQGYNRESHYVGEDNLTVDHVIPLSKGGSDCVENLQMMCALCNSAKGTK